LFVVTPQAQQSQSELMTFFYRDPNPERLIGFLEKLDASNSVNWEAYPPTVGFLAIIFRTYPNFIETLIPIDPKPRTADAVAAALLLSGNKTTIAKFQSRFDAAGSDPRLHAALLSLPERIEDIRVRTPTHLDILWGASFASGDGHFVRMIVDFFAGTANRSGDIALDVLQTAVALSGGPRDILGTLRGKYGDENTVEIIYAATALWSLEANSEQHPFVRQVLTEYIQDHGDTAAWVLDLLIHRKK
jgi:hypothetical protein